MDVKDLQRQVQWWSAFYRWYETGDKTQIVDLLQRGEPLSKKESYLLAAIISGEWKRPKKFGDSKGVTAQFEKDLTREYYKHAVEEEAKRLKKNKRPGEKLDVWREAINAVSKNWKPFKRGGGHSPSSIEKHLRLPERQYQKSSRSAYDAFHDDAHRILAKLDL